jgi:predicted Fe-Mo cluster-binding NifX family protein
MKKIALPVNENMIEPHFGQAHYFKFYMLNNQSIESEDLIKAPKHNPHTLPLWLAKNHVTDVIVAGIGLKAIEILNQNKINVFVGVRLKNPDELVKDFLDGTLETNGNLCDH